MTLTKLAQASSRSWVMGRTVTTKKSAKSAAVDPIKPETILELAYIRDPKLFDRNAETHEEASRVPISSNRQVMVALSKVTIRANKISLPGWTDEQIEGWRIMLERNPKKARILQKHEFSGNRRVNMPITGGSRDRPGGGRGGRGRDRGRGRGRGRGGGGGSRPGERKDEMARERAFKEKHKSSNRKRGHDKKMVKAGAGPAA
ncbi:hypothetical protein J3R83DRAFT_4983 [Lanmaoa asiatica]|nr:hypothetical protein J3R83DRAFT_4983 [Lanmaoa asiatica]